MKPTRPLTKEEQNAMVEVLVRRYDEAMTKLPLKKSVRECLRDGFRDGARSAVQLMAAQYEIYREGDTL